MIESGKTFLDGILFNAFNAVYSQFSLFPFCLSVFDCSHEISQCTSKIIRGTECVNKGHGVNGFIDEQINNALIKQLTRWWKWKTGEQMNRNNVTGIIATTKNSKDYSSEARHRDDLTRESIVA